MLMYQSSSRNPTSENVQILFYLFFIIVGGNEGVEAWQLQYASPLLWAVWQSFNDGFSVPKDADKELWM